MALTIKTPPETTLTDGHVCKFSHGYNPTYIDFQRQDTSVIAVAFYQTKIALVVNNSSMFAIGSNLYCEVSGNEYSFSGTFLVLNILEILGLKYVVIDKPHSTLTGVSGFANTATRRNHKVYVRLNISGTITTERSFHTNEQGVARCYLNSIFTDYFKSLPEIDYTELIQIVEDFVISFLVQAKEEWIGFDDTYKTFTGTWRAVNSVTQLNNDNRMVLKEVYYEDATTLSTAQFLTGFVEPVYFVGYPFTVSVLIGQSVLNLKRVIDDSVGSKDNENIPAGNFNQVNAFTLNALNATEPHVLVYIETLETSAFGNYADDYAINYTT
jgi:hypothetical protein